MDILFPFSESKLKPLLKMASKRIQIANSKRTAQSSHGKREVNLYFIFFIYFVCLFCFVFVRLLN